MRRVMLLLVVAVVIGLVMVGGVEAFESPISLISPISPVIQAPPLPSDGETVTIGDEWGDQAGVVVETPTVSAADDDGDGTITDDPPVVPTVRLCVGLTSGHVICYEVW